MPLVATEPCDDVPIIRTAPMKIGTAGWTISREASDAFPGEGRHLERYAKVL
jgi:hypothetical protein